MGLELLLTGALDLALQMVDLLASHGNFPPLRPCPSCPPADPVCQALKLAVSVVRSALGHGGCGGD